jgi:spore germination protein
MIKIGTLWCYLFSLLLLLCSCAEPKILEKVGLITTMGYDLGKNGSYLGTMVELKIDPNAPKDVVIFDSESLSIRGIRSNANNKTSKRLTTGQLRVILYGEEMLKNGETRIAPILTSDPAISDTTYIAMVDGSARDLLHLKSAHIPDIGIHIYRLMDQNTKSKKMPLSTIQEVLHDHHTIGKEPVLPILSKLENKRGDNKGVVYKGVALFKGTKLVGKLNMEQSFYIPLINDKYKSGTKDIIIHSNSAKLKKEEGISKKMIASLDSIRSRSKIKLINKEKLEYEVDIKLNGRMLEINSPIDLGNPKNMKLIEKEITKSMKKDIEKLIALCQSKNSDVFGLGEVYRSSVRHSKLTDEKWYKMYKNAKVNVNVDFSVIRTGLNE